MQRPDYDSPRALKQILEQNEFSMQKKFGQNFLVNKSAREKIVSLLGASAGDSVWEIGPGLGAITSLMIDAKYDISAFEIDHGFIRLLKSIFENENNFKIVEGDVLKTWKIHKDEKPKFIIGNLPYNVAGGIIADFIEFEMNCEKMVFTVQKESADRMKARPESKNYSSFSVLCQSAYKVTSALELKPGSFWPAPEITSTVVVLDKKKDFPELTNRKLFLQLVRAVFATRRKTLRNNLKASGFDSELSLNALETLHINPEQRAETLSPETLALLANEIAKTQDSL